MRFLWFKSRNNSKSLSVKLQKISVASNNILFQKDVYRRLLDDVLLQLKNIGYGPLRIVEIRKKTIEIVSALIKSGDSPLIEEKVKQEILDFYINLMNKNKYTLDIAVRQSNVDIDYLNKLFKIECGYQFDLLEEIEYKIRELESFGFNDNLLSGFRREIKEIIKNNNYNQLSFNSNRDLFFLIEKYFDNKVNMLEDNSEELFSKVI